VDTREGNAVPKRRIAATAALAVAAGSLSVPLAAHAATTSSSLNFYVNDGVACSDTTADSATTP
jgi:hypothetical protein